MKKNKRVLQNIILLFSGMLSLFFSVCYLKISDLNGSVVKMEITVSDSQKEKSEKLESQSDIEVTEYDKNKTIMKSSEQSVEKETNEIVGLNVDESIINEITVDEIIIDDTILDESVIDEDILVDTENIIEPDIYTGPDDYIISDSSVVYLDSSDIENMTLKELCYAKNEIYARHGRRFKTKELQEYFDSKNWYQGIMSPEEFDRKGENNIFNAVEKSNRDLLSSTEKARKTGGYPVDQDFDNTPVRKIR